MSTDWLGIQLKRPLSDDVQDYLVDDSLHLYLHHLRQGDLEEVDDGFERGALQHQGSVAGDECQGHLEQGICALNEHHVCGHKRDNPASTPSASFSWLLFFIMSTWYQYGSNIVLI